MKYLLCVLISFVFIFCGCITASAVEIEDIKPLTEMDLPDEVGFYVSPVCFGHNYFEQADVDEKGNFIILSSCTEPASASENLFQTEYIDVYNENNEFICEISFTGTGNTVARISDDCVYIVMFNNMIVYDLAEETVAYYSFPGNSVWKNTVSDLSRGTEFTVGQHNYRCERDINLDFIRLVRSDEISEEVIIEMPGKENIFEKALRNVIIPYFVIIILIVVLITLLLKKYKKQKHKKLPHKHTRGDVL